MQTHATCGGNTDATCTQRMLHAFAQSQCSPEKEIPVQHVSQSTHTCHVASDATQRRPTPYYETIEKRKTTTLTRHTKDVCDTIQ